MTQSHLVMEPVLCGVCQSANAQLVTVGRDFEYSTSDDEFSVYKCDACGNLYLNPRPAISELPRIYPPDYYSYNYESSIHPIAIKAKEFLDQGKVRKWLKHCASKQPRFLDVGCGDGRYLKMIHALGTSKENLYGVELDERPIAQLKAQGFNAFCGRIEDVEEQLPSNAFDLIVSLQVLEHVSEPSEMIGIFARLLAPGGTLIIETPNTDSWDYKIFEHKYWGGYHFPRHWNLFNPNNLRIMAQTHNLKVKQFNYLPAQSFWIFSLHHLIEDKYGATKWASAFNPFRNIPLLCLFTGLDIARACLGFKTSNIQMVACKDK